MKSFLKIPLLIAMLGLLYGCGGGGGGEQEQIEPQETQELPSCAPDYHTNCPSGEGDSLYFCGFSGDTLSEEEAREKAVNDAKEKAIQYFGQYVESMSTIEMVSEETNDDFSAQSTMESVVNLYASGELKEVQAKHQIACEYKTNIFAGYAMIEVSKDALEPSESDLVTELKQQTKNSDQAFVYSVDILCYNDATQQTRKLSQTDRIQTGENIKIRVQVNEPRYLYITNVDAQQNAYVLFPRSEISYSNPLQSGRMYEFPEGSSWYPVDEVIGTEIMDILILETEDPEVNRLISAIQTEGTQAAYEQFSQSHQVGTKGIGASLAVRNEATVTSPSESNPQTLTYSSQDVLSLAPEKRLRYVFSHE